MEPRITNVSFRVSNCVCLIWYCHLFALFLTKLESLDLCKYYHKKAPLNLGLMSQKIQLQAQYLYHVSRVCIPIYTPYHNTITPSLNIPVWPYIFTAPFCRCRFGESPRMPTILPPPYFLKFIYYYYYNNFVALHKKNFFWTNCMKDFTKIFVDSTTKVQLKN